MTAHTCTEFNPDCYRCDLSRDEVRRIGRGSTPAARAEALAATRAAIDAARTRRTHANEESRDE